MTLIDPHFEADGLPPFIECTVGEQKPIASIFGIPVVEVTGMSVPVLVASDWASYIILRDNMTEEIFSLEHLRRDCMRLMAKRIRDANT